MKKRIFCALSSDPKARELVDQLLRSERVAEEVEKIQRTTMRLPAVKGEKNGRRPAKSARGRVRTK